MDKPVYAGLSILDLSKLSMAKFHYDTFKKLYPADRSQLLYTDTDSLLYAVITENVYNDIKKPLIIMKLILIFLITLSITLIEIILTKTK